MHVVAALHGAVADDAFERRADGCEREVTFGLGERRLQLVERARGFLLLRLQHVDIGVGSVDGGSGALHGGERLIAVGLRLLQLLLAGELLVGECC